MNQSFLLHLLISTQGNESILLYYLPKSVLFYLSHYGLSTAEMDIDVQRRSNVFLFSYVSIQLT